MKKVFFSLFIMIACRAGFAQSLAPSIISSDGGHSVTTAGSISWTIGEPLTETSVASGSIVTQGFQQPVVRITKVKTESTNNTFNYYPNPFASNFFIEIENGSSEFSINAYNVTGEKIKAINYSKNNSRGLINMDLSDCADGVYLIEVRDQSTGQRNVFKITKTN
jgi:hypothetical protein